MWGRGTNNIIEDCRKAGLSEPEFIDERNSVGIRFRSYVGKETEVIEDNLTPRQKEILSILAEVSEASMKDIIVKLVNPPSERMVRKDLSVLKDRDIVANKGFGRGSRWMLKKEEPNKELIRQ